MTPSSELPRVYRNWMNLEGGVSETMQFEGWGSEITKFFGLGSETMRSNGWGFETLRFDDWKVREEATGETGEHGDWELTKNVTGRHSLKKYNSYEVNIWQKSLSKIQFFPLQGLHFLVVRIFYLPLSSRRYSFLGSFRLKFAVPERHGQTCSLVCIQNKNNIVIVWEIF